MLRNLNRSYARGRVCGTPHVGVLGSEIPSSGDNGPGYAYNDLSLPADANKEICGRITTWPSAGTLTAYEDTSFTFTGAPDGIHTFQYQLYVDYVATGGPTTVTLTVGDGVVAGSAAWTEANDTASGSGTMTVSGSGSATESNDSATGSGVLTVSGTSVTTEADDAAAGSGTLSVSGTSSTTEANDTASASGTVTSDGSVIGTITATEADDQADAQGVVCARAPRGCGYRRPFINTKRLKN